MERQMAAKAPRGNGSLAAKQSNSARPPAHPILALQQTIGNQAVQRLLQSSQIQAKLKISQPGDPFEQEADRVADTVMRMPEPASPEEEKTSVQTKTMAAQITPLVQRESEPSPEEKKEEVVAAKLLLQRVPVAVREDDEEEKVAPKLDTNFSPQEEEKEKTVETKLAKDTPLQRQAVEDEEKKEETLQTATPSNLLIQRLCAGCEEEHSQTTRLDSRSKNDRGTQVQRKDESAASSQLTPPVSDDISVLQGGGNPLPPSTRAFFEPRFGADFSRVRTHTGVRAAETAAAIQARAFTIGRDIVFGLGEYAPESREGRKLLVHELTHVVQQDGANGTPHRIQRQTAPSGTTSIPPADPPKRKFPTTGETATFAGIELTENPDQLREEMFRLVVTGLPKRPVPPGILAPNTFLNLIMMSTPPMVCGEPGTAGYEDCHRREVLKTKIVPVLSRVVAEVYAQSVKILADFEKVMKDNALQTLAASKVRAETERIKYGITTKKEKRTGLFRTDTVTTHSIADTQSPTVRLMREAAKLLLARRYAIRAKAQEANRHFACAHGMCAGDREYNRLNAELLQLRRDYQKFHQQISFEYPLLDRIGAIGEEPGIAENAAWAFTELERVANSKSETEVAATVGEQIEDTLEKNERARQGVDGDKVNLWRLKEVFGLSKAQAGVDEDPFRKKLVEERWQREQPKIIDAILEGIALLALNIGAILLAAPTGGASLAVAFGVNAALAAKHTMDYLLDKAVAGSDLRRAQALSQDDPSFVWLAIEIIGVGLDGAAAVTAIRAMRPAVKAAEIASKEGKLVDAIKNIEETAKPFEKPDLAKRVIAKLPKARTAAMEFAGGTEAEVGQWARATRAIEADAADTLGKSVVRNAAGGEIKLSKGGYLFSCSSPCQVLRDKYAHIFAQDKQLESALVNLERRAKDAATKGGDEAAKLSDLVKQDAAALERRIELGLDPKRGYIPHEGEVGALIESRFGGFARDPSGAGEWIGTSGKYKGKVFDVVGIPEGKAVFHSDALEKFLPSVDSHFLKSIDFVILDTRYMTAGQKQTVLNYINKRWASEVKRLIIL